MGQVKKAAVLEAIQAAAFDLFVQQGYAGTSMPQIARAAGISTANVYVYFGSKLAILYAIYDPWIRERLHALRAELATIKNPSRRLYTLFRSYWRDIPAENGGFANNIIQAISTAGADDQYRPALAEWMEGQLREMVLEALPGERRHLVRKPPFAHLMLMAFNGFTVYHHISPGRPCDDDTIDLVCKLLLGSDFSRAKAHAA
ncbi:MAG: TetR/AcrR family transcriptional regulator [Polaromonas sp.]|nr:TetR/AcrR family transcriptional regulator [Polaromonas sp.]